MAIDTQKLLPRSKKGDLNPTHVESLIDIKVKIVSARDILKGTLAAEKAAFKDQQRDDEGEERDEEEDKLETPKDAKKAGVKMPALPGASFLQKAKTFIGTILLGFAISKLLKFLPKLMPLVKLLAGIAKFVIKIGGVILEGLINFVDWGYKAHDKTKAWITEKWGDGAAQKFSNFTGLMTKMMNTIFILGMTTAAFADALGGINPLELLDNLKNKKWVQKLLQRGRILTKKSTRFLTRRVARPLARVGTRISNETWLRRRQLQRTGSQVLENLADTKVGRAIRNVDPKKIVSKGRELVGGGLKNVSKAGDFLFGRTFRQIGAAKDWVVRGTKSNWGKIVEGGKKLYSKIGSQVSKWGDDFAKLTEAGKKLFLEKVLAPIKAAFDPVMKKVKSLGGTIMRQLEKIPGFEKLTQALAKKGTKFGGGNLLKFIGDKGIPILGGIVNLIFAYDRARMGDSVGALIEALSGAADISTLFGFAPGYGISLGLDAYMFGRDLLPEFFPEADLKKGEDAAIDALGLSGFKSQVDGMLKNLPPLPNIGKMLSGTDKSSSVNVGVLPKGTALTPINVSDVQKNNNSKINAVSKSTSYEEGSNKTVVITPSDRPTTVNNTSNNQRELVVAGSSTSNESSDSSESEYFYKKAG